MHNSTYVDVRRSFIEIKAVLKELENNCRRSRILFERRRLTSIPALYSKMRKQIE